MIVTASSVVGVPTIVAFISVFECKLRSKVAPELKDTEYVVMFGDAERKLKFALLA